MSGHLHEAKPDKPQGHGSEPDGATIEDVGREPASESDDRFERDKETVSISRRFPAKRGHDEHGDRDHVHDAASDLEIAVRHSSTAIVT